MREAKPRAYARQHAMEGVALLAHAVNACDRPHASYRFAAAEQRRFLRLVRELHDLIEHGEIVALAPSCTPTDTEHDSEFQRFMALLAVAIAKPRGKRAR